MQLGIGRAGKDTTKMEQARSISHPDSSPCIISSHFPQMARYRLFWASWCIENGRCHRALPLLLETADLLKENDCTADLDGCLTLLGEALRSVGRLEEAEAALLDAISLSMTFEYPGANIPAQFTLMKVYLEMENAAMAFQWAYEQLETYQQGEQPVDRWRYHSLLMTIAEACWAGGAYTTTIECMEKVARAMGGDTVRHVRSDVLYSVLMAHVHLTYAHICGNDKVEQQLQSVLRYYYRMVEQGQMISPCGGRCTLSYCSCLPIPSACWARTTRHAASRTRWPRWKPSCRR